MIPVMSHGGSPARSCRVPAAALIALLTVWQAGPSTANPTQSAAPAGAEPPNATGIPRSSPAADCLESGDGYFRARIAGAIDAKINWPNSGTRCQGESKSMPPGVRMSFQRSGQPKPDLLFVFGLTGVREGQPVHAAGANLTLIVQGTPKIFGTLGDSRCTVDSLTQRRLRAPGAYRVEARGFCTQPAREVRGTGEVLVRTFEFAGLVNYGTAAGAGAAGAGIAAQTRH
jgi:hypothetical protein